ncbi:PQQ-binding-like beta-propeller repeat protein [Tuwongella immobilis]|uniref:Pyrrolo-quinoline quinone repeat domain-containing protein n=1 Tax=Tuwongella immobilis TaxID=692036 RepID=A0A6C2YSW5_9BACT|nr:PQQ-binding-like beta-propeller repeat protein [Tuwongella immobilis]VIP04471.1 Uncharacterized protein OS=Pirellula staleyi (strain ATCC 27377 / DSM 6068 / ICPB 4128) GN=Psta_1858 PE=4 SV=1: PQQ_2 [Tuwongella immobilis]VTS06304.1 Uncharacterized protein OS=Pirellula staleyi (strain ATCC 27377 / DSM 6068 / ICPB 4128) GN=Psta_1858 PE=4 SV=1: PQQ_2 [Tuwongella immobilis]
MRRSATAILMILLVIGAPATRAEDWPKWRGPRGDGTWNGPKLPEQWPQSGLKPAWKVPIGGGYAGISVADGRVLTMDVQLDGTQQVERVVALSLADGKLLWEHRTPVKYGNLGGYANGPRAAPTIHGDRVYTLGAVGHAACLEVATGKVVWQRDLVKEVQAEVPTWGFAASPVIDGDKVYLHVAAKPNGCILALNRHTGREIWRSLPDPAGYCTPILIDAPSGPMMIVWTPEFIRGIDPADGKPLWKVPYPITYGVSIATPIYRDGILFITGYWDGSKAIRLGPKPTDFELIWEDRRNLRGLMAQPLERNGIVYTIDKGNGLTAFDLKTGRKRWDDENSMTPAGRNPHASFVWLNGSDRILSLNSRGELILGRLSPEGFQEQSRTQVLSGAVWSHPAFAGKFLIARNDGGERPTATGPYELVCIPLVE